MTIAGVTGLAAPGAAVDDKGRVTEFSDGITPGVLDGQTFGAGPTAITAGSDDNLWFTELAGRIGRITPAGVVTEFSDGITTGAVPYGIAVGCDGNLWFTEVTGNRIGRMISTNAVRELAARGIENLMLLRGDPSRDQPSFVPAPGIPKFGRCGSSCRRLPMPCPTKSRTTEQPSLSTYR